jgi:hypothetical protein
MHDSHREAAEQQEFAACDHRIAADHNEEGDNEAGRWHAERALEYSEDAYKLAKEPTRSQSKSRLSRYVHAL